VNRTSDGFHSLSDVNMIKASYVLNVMDSMSRPGGSYFAWSSRTEAPTAQPSHQPTYEPTHRPTYEPTDLPTYEPTHRPTDEPTLKPTTKSTLRPSHMPTVARTSVGQVFSLKSNSSLRQSVGSSTRPVNQHFVVLSEKKEFESVSNHNSNLSVF
jgi:hypothetical protein